MVLYFMFFLFSPQWLLTLLFVHVGWEAWYDLFPFLLSGSLEKGSGTTCPLTQLAQFSPALRHPCVSTSFLPHFNINFPSFTLHALGHLDFTVYHCEVGVYLKKKKTFQSAKAFTCACAPCHFNQNALKWLSHEKSWKPGKACTWLDWTTTEPKSSLAAVALWLVTELWWMNLACRKHGVPFTVIYRVSDTKSHNLPEVSLQDWENWSLLWLSPAKGPLSRAARSSD